MEYLRVIAAEGRVPMEHQVGWIEREPVVVHDSYYYRQMLACKSLLLSPETKPESSAQGENPLTDEETDGH